MANVLITNLCNANCEFCFAQEVIQAEPKYLDLALVKERVDWIQRSGLTQVRLMGGEPSLHPQFVEIARQVSAAGLTLVVFSNGFMPPAVMEYLASLPDSACAVLMNVNAQHRSPTGESLRIEALRQLGRKVTLGYTILNPVFDLSMYYDWITQYDCQPRFRLGLAQPIYGGQNAYLPPKRYRSAAGSILKNARQAASMGICLEFDCGFVRCMFSEKDRSDLERLGVTMESHCAPNVDIGMAGEIFHCFSLSQMAVPLASCSDVREAVHLLDARRSPFRESGIYPECADCAERLAGQCCAGCLSLTLHRYHPGLISL